MTSTFPAKTAVDMDAWDKGRLMDSQEEDLADYDEKRIVMLDSPIDTPNLACSLDGDVETTPRIITNDVASKSRFFRLICELNGCFAARMQAKCTKTRLGCAVSHNTMNCAIHLTTSTKQNFSRATLPCCAISITSNTIISISISTASIR